MTGLASGIEVTERSNGSFQVRQDESAPALEVMFPESTVYTDHILLKGRTDRGMTIYVADQRVPVSDTGEFEFSVDLKLGLNVVVVEALDQAGNTTYQSKVINRKR